MLKDLKIISNTDAVDIDAKSFGLYAYVKDFETRNRSLHIQVRHNMDREAWEKARTISDLIAASPKMFRLLERIYKDQLSHGENADFELLTEIESTLLTIRR